MEIKPRHSRSAGAVAGLVIIAVGVILSSKGDYASAAEQFRNYLRHVPSATNVTAVKKMLAEAESHLEQSKRP
jgi:hypothetical protein